MNTFVQVASKCSNPLNRVNGAMSQILVTWKIATGRDVVSARGRWYEKPMNENRKSQGGRSIFLLLTRGFLYCSRWVAGIR